MWTHFESQAEVWIIPQRVPQRGHSRIYFFGKWGEESPTRFSGPRWANWLLGGSFSNFSGSTAHFSHRLITMKDLVKESMDQKIVKSIQTKNSFKCKVWIVTTRHPKTTKGKRPPRFFKRSFAFHRAFWTGSILCQRVSYTWHLGRFDWREHPRNK